MPLNDGYGVVIGSLNHYERDPINDYGQYFHENIYVNTPAGTYHCAVDVDSKKTKNGVEWRVVPLEVEDIKGIETLTAGWHNLVSNSASGALDYIRTAAFHRPGCTVIFFRYDPFFERLRQLFNRFINPPWESGTSIDALAALEPLLDDAQKLFIFGEPFTYGGLGVHNIHQNQGDPAGTPWWTENGIWQDGGTIIQKQDGTYFAFLNKFNTQANNTDDDGHPL